MVVRSAQKGRDDIQRIRDAMEGGKPVVTDFLRELIVKQANMIGEDGRAMVEDIEDAAASTTTKLLPTDVFKMIEGCVASLDQKVRIRMQSDVIIVEKEPERLKQLEAIREQATMLHESRLNRDKVTEESVVRTMRDTVIGFMAAVDQDKEDGLDPDTARLWKEQVQGIVTLANLDVPAAGTSGDEPEPTPQGGATDCLAPLKNAIDQARYTADAVTRELTDPEETVLRGFGKQLGSSKKEIMALSKNLAMGQPASVATEASRLASEACDAIKVSRESIRAALREMGAASDVSEASGPVRSQPLLPERPSMGRLEPAGRRPTVPVPTWSQRPPPREWATGPQPAGAEWVQRPPPHEGGLGGHGGRLAPTAHTGNLGMATSRNTTEAQDKRGGRGAVGPHEGHDERPGERQWLAHVQWEVRGIPPVPQGVVGLQADVPWARARRAGMPQSQREEPGQQRPPLGKRHR
jgi:hypothetical protein